MRGYVSWNGATDVSHYEIYAGLDDSKLARTGITFEKRGFETAFVERNIKAADVAPFVAPLHVLNDPFEDYMAYLRVSQSNVERLYQLDLQHGFEGAGSDDSRKFTEQRIAAGASMLRDLIETAWLNSAKPLPPPQD